MSQETITFQIDREKIRELETIATSIDRDRTYVLQAAIDSYLEIHRWQIEEIEKGLLEAEAGDFASEEEVQAVFAKLTNEN
ncbi:MAG: CopG family transcriptional regulator [Hormoscilla sp. SP5CHS1]|nr:CopG family transcriptional regulator [Hormoscilla sp. SP12CHS1]MBC6455320.1 CopG family transcriptional regulator [Hormoscilla sp. SP5CHS1]MBC6471958.1 CopG family transcriptional regulator [Hormoscilla sp. GM102CHS1]